VVLCILKRIFAHAIEGGKEVLKSIMVNITPGEDWNLFQICLKFLQSFGNYCECIKTLNLFYKIAVFIYRRVFTRIISHRIRI
jgi:hypothetical protein